jgi:TatD DNase family protein
MLFDAHNHLQDAWLVPHHAAIFADLARAHIAGAVVNGTSPSDWADVTALAREHPLVRASYGLHPWDVGNAPATWKDGLLSILAASPTPAMGEIGLDRWILDRARPDDPRLAGLRRAPLPEQVEAFTWQLAHAAERNLPTTIHCLDAWGELLRVLQRSARPARGFLLHAYGGSAELAREFTALGAYFSFNGYFLNERHAAKRAVFAALPVERVLVETDAPAMLPPPEQRPYSLPGLADGTVVNHPANLVSAYAGLAAIRSTPLPDLTAQIAENFHRLFG